MKAKAARRKRRSKGMVEDCSGFRALRHNRDTRMPLQSEGGAGNMKSGTIYRAPTKFKRGNVVPRFRADSFTWRVAISSVPRLLRGLFCWPDSDHREFRRRA